MTRSEPRDGTGSTALVTGASAGIGAELARVFAAKGFDLVLTARRAERLAALAEELRGQHGVRVQVIPGDLALPETPALLTSALERDGVVIDALVNNAGFAVPGRYRDTSWDAQRDFLQVLVTAPCELIQRLLPGMTQRGYGRILNVASVAGLMPGAASHTLVWRRQGDADQDIAIPAQRAEGDRGARHRAVPRIYLLGISRCHRNARGNAPDAQGDVAVGRSRCARTATRRS